MVVNLCLPHFHTTVHCNKLCADGYDVTNLVSADPAVRKRGFKLEYFLRPPVQVTLTFDFKVELCRVDVELWPWGMDRGQACKKLEISTSSDPLPHSSYSHIQQKTNRENSQKKECKLTQSKGHQWSIQAQNWDKEAGSEPQSSKCQSNTVRESGNAEFKLVGRCELREETKVCFSCSHFRPRSPFLSAPPPVPVNCLQEELWSRGVHSLSAVTQLRVALPFGGAASALGLKALSVWGRPAQCCRAEEVERIQKAHEACERWPSLPVSFTSSVCLAKQQKKAATTLSLPVPEEFLDPITQEVMLLPMLLPNGVSVDNSTLEEYQKREATWCRPPNDPFTGVPFTASSQPLPNPQLKSRIDQFLLRTGEVGAQGRLGRQAEGENPHPSRLIASELDRTLLPYNCALTENWKIKCHQTRKRDFTGTPTDSTEESQLPQSKRPRSNNETSEPSCSSHEQRLSASLDEALSSALEGRPSFTSNLSLHKRLDTEPHDEPQHSHTKGTGNMDEKTCSACSRSVSVYATPAFPIYRLTCGHLLCRSCLQKKPSLLNSSRTSTTNHIQCPTCQSTTPRGDILRVHH